MAIVLAAVATARADVAAELARMLKAHPGAEGVWANVLRI
jgi:hypothetical protein